MNWRELAGDLSAGIMLIIFLALLNGSVLLWTA